MEMSSDDDAVGHDAVEGEPGTSQCVTRQTPQSNYNGSEGAEGSRVSDRQVRKRHIDNGSEGAEGSRVSDRQVRKRSIIRSRSRERSKVLELTSRVRKQNSYYKVNDNDERDIRFEHAGRVRTRQLDTPPRSRRSPRSPARSPRRLGINLVSEDKRGTRASRRRRRDDSTDSCDSYIERLLKRRRSRSPSRHAQREIPDVGSSTTNAILDKFLDILSNVKGQSTTKLSLTNVVPEFDPMCKDQTIIMWLTKVEECADIYGWNERETIHFALPKLTGVAKQWYQGLSTVLYTWTEWKRKLIESFPCRQDYSELLTEMLAKRVRYGESLEQYYYTKINLLNRCGITGLKAVDCLLQGVDDRAVRVGAQAANYREPEGVLKYFKTVKPANNKDNNDKSGQDKRTTQSNNDKIRVDSTGKKDSDIVCHNCDEEGHKSFNCRKPPSKCNSCGRMGHLEKHCRSKQSNNHNKDRVDAEKVDK